MNPSASRPRRESRWPLLVLGLALGCRFHPDCALVTLERDRVQASWLGQQGRPSFSRSSEHWGALPDTGPVSLAILPLDQGSLREEPDCDDCPRVRSVLGQVFRPRWTPNPGSRVRLVESPEGADWVLESRIVGVRVGNSALIPGPHPESLIPDRAYRAESWFRIRDRRSGRLLWACRVAPPAETEPPWGRVRAAPLEKHLARHFDLLTVHLNAALNGSPGL